MSMTVPTDAEVVIYSKMHTIAHITSPRIQQPSAMTIWKGITRPTTKSDTARDSRRKFVVVWSCLWWRNKTHASLQHVSRRKKNLRRWNQWKLAKSHVDGSCTWNGWWRRWPGGWELKSAGKWQRAACKWAQSGRALAVASGRRRCGGEGNKTLSPPGSPWWQRDLELRGGRCLTAAVLYSWSCLTSTSLGVKGTWE